MASEITEEKIEKSGKHSREEEENKETTSESPLKKQKLCVGSSVSDEDEKPGDGDGDGASHGTKQESEPNESVHSEPVPVLTDSMIERVAATYGLVYIGDGFFEEGPDHEQKINALLEHEAQFHDEVGDWRQRYGVGRNQIIYCIWLTDKSWDNSECKIILRENGCSESCFLRRSRTNGSIFYAALDDVQAAKLKDVNEVVRMVPLSEMCCVD